MIFISLPTKRSGFSVIDVTGGAPELVPGIEGFLERLAPLAPRTLFRTNLTALAGRACTLTMECEEWKKTPRQGVREVRIRSLAPWLAVESSCAARKRRRSR